MGELILDYKLYLSGAFPETKYNHIIKNRWFEHIPKDSLTKFRIPENIKSLQKVYTVFRLHLLIWVLHSPIVLVSFTITIFYSLNANNLMNVNQISWYLHSSLKFVVWFKYLIGKKEISKKRQSLGWVTNIFYRPKFFTNFFLPTIHFYQFFWPKILHDFLFSFLSAFRRKMSQK